MTTASDILDGALARGCTFTTHQPDGLHVAARKGTLTPDLVADLRRFKLEIRRLLLLRQASAPTYSNSAPVTPATGPLRPPPISLGQRGRRARVYAPETLHLLQWFKETEPELPCEPFHLAAWLHVTDPVKFFDRLRAEAARFPYGDRPDGLITDLRLLQSLVNARQGKSGST